MTVCTRKKDGQVFVQYKKDGKTKRTYFGVGIEAKAKAEAYNLTVAKKQPSKVEPTFMQLAKAYLSAKKAHFSTEEYKSYGWRFRKVLPILGDIIAISLRHSDFDNYITTRRSQAVAMSTIVRELADIRAILNWSVQRQYIAHSPMVGYKFPRKNGAVIQPPSTNEIERLIANAAPHLRRAILLSYFLGLRPGAVELCSIKYNQINWSAKTITVISAKKGGVKCREVPLHSLLPIREWYEEDGSQDDRHIITWRGKPIKRLNKAFDQAKRRAKISKDKKMPPYALRHAFVSELLHAGVNPYAIASISGHDVRTMMQYYAHTMGNSQVVAISALPSININS